MSLKTRQPRTHTHISIQHPPPDSYAYDDSTSYYEESHEDDIADSESHAQWGDDEDALDPSDSASGHGGHPHYHQRIAQAPRRSHTRLPVTHPAFRDQQQSPGPPHAAYPPPNLEHEEPWGGRPYGQGYAPARQPGFYGGGGGGRPGPGYGGAAHAPYGVGAGYAANGGMVPFQQQYGGHPYGHPAYGNEMMPFGGPNGFYGDPRQYAMPAHMQQYQVAAPPPPTEAPARPPSAPKEDPEKKKLEEELARIKADQDRIVAFEKQKEREMQIRRDAEEAFQRKMMEMQRAQEETRKEIEKAKIEAERAARERLETERKNEAERQRQHQENMKRAEENARMKFEAEQKAAEERRKAEEEARKRAEETARIRLEAAMKAQAEAVAAAEKKKAEEAERIKKIEEDAKRKAEADAAAKVEKDKADAAAKAAAEADAKKEQEELKKKWQAEATEKAEEAKKKAEKPPIKFKDAVNRKFSFPFHLCQTWTGMEELIKQAFLQVDVLGPHVQEGHYDLTGPDGEIILPSVWEKVIQPDWSITMTMWPLDQRPPVDPRRSRPGGHGGVPPLPPVGPQQRGGPPGGIPVPPGWNRRHDGRGVPPGVDILTAEPRGSHKKSSKKKKEPDSFLRFLGGSKPKKKHSKG